jgi:hypothetical protein
MKFTMIADPEAATALVMGGFVDALAADIDCFKEPLAMEFLEVVGSFGRCGPDVMAAVRESEVIYRSLRALAETDSAEISNKAEPLLKCLYPDSPGE